MKPNFLFFIATLPLVLFRRILLKEGARLCCLLSCDIFVIQRNDKNLENVYFHDAINYCERWRAYSPLPKIEFQLRYHDVLYRPVIHILWLSISSMSYLLIVCSFFFKVNHWYWSKYFLSTTGKQWRSPMVSIIIIDLKRGEEFVQLIYILL